jgi:hypothetical protein
MTIREPEAAVEMLPVPTMMPAVIVPAANLSAEIVFAWIRAALKNPVEMVAASTEPIWAEPIAAFWISDEFAVMTPVTICAAVIVFAAILDAFNWIVVHAEPEYCF